MWGGGEGLRGGDVDANLVAWNIHSVIQKSGGKEHGTS